MKWLPYDCWTIESPLDVGTLVAGMQQHIELRKWLRLGGGRAALEGTVHERGFSANRITGYRISFLPMLYGEFLAGQRGTTIRVRMTLHPLYHSGGLTQGAGRGMINGSGCTAESSLPVVRSARDRAMVYRGHVARGVIVLDGGDSLPDGTVVTVMPVDSDMGVADGDRVYELAELAVPTGVADLAVNVDHYLYGHPKVGNA